MAATVSSVTPSDPPRGHPDELATFLGSERAPAGVMDPTTLDVFLTGVAVAPDRIPPSEWLPSVGAPVFASRSDNAWFHGALMARYNVIVRCAAETEAEKLAPHIAWTDDGKPAMAAWSEGFFAAIELRPTAWRQLMGDPAYAELLAPVAAFVSPDGEPGDPALGPLLGADRGDEAAKEAARLIPRVVPLIYRYWREVAQAAGCGTPAGRRKVGRNDPCPCGSGRKAKRCCGAG